MVKKGNTQVQRKTTQRKNTPKKSTQSRKTPARKTTQKKTVQRKTTQRKSPQKETVVEKMEIEDSSQNNMEVETETEAYTEVELNSDNGITNSSNQASSNASSNKASSNPVSQPQFKKKREFKIVLDDPVAFGYPETKKYYGSYKANKPNQAGSKALTSLTRLKKRNNIDCEGEHVFTIQEHFPKKVQGRRYAYVGEKIELDEPIKVVVRKNKGTPEETEEVIVRRYKNVVRKYKPPQDEGTVANDENKE